jgi:hypothetical protein
MRPFKLPHHPDTPQITEAFEIAANIAANAFIALVFIGGIILGLAI